jgi:DNA-directed RNA polymerase subunit RPC12/RpoP
MTEALILAAFLALIPAFIARHKSRGFWTFYVFGLLLWIVALPVAVLMKDDRRRCPYCVEPIAANATVCPHCGSALTVMQLRPTT